jgi:septation ring formation regulator EzrA
MADPTNPNNPVDPGVGAQFNDMAGKMRDAQAWAAEHKKAADEAERSTNAIHRAGEAVKKEVDGYKALTKVMKQMAIEMKTQGREASNIREELEKIVEAHEEALKNERAGSKEFKLMRDHLHRVKKELDALPPSGKVLEQQINRINDMMEDLGTNVKNVAKAMANLGRVGANVRGFAGIAEAMGMGRPASYMDRKLEKV